MLLEHSCNKVSYQLIDIDYKVQILLGYPQGKHTLKEKLRALQNSMNMGIWVIGTLNELFIRAFLYSKLNFQTPFFMVDPFCTPHSICLDIGFGQGSSVWKCCSLNCRALN